MVNRKRKQTIELLDEFELGERRILLVKDERQYAVVVIKTVDRCVTKKYKYGELKVMKKLFYDLVNELKKGDEYGREN